MDTQSWRKISSWNIADSSWKIAFTTKQHDLARYAGGLAEEPSATDHWCHTGSEEEELSEHATGHSISARYRSVQRPNVVKESQIRGVYGGVLVP